MKFPEQEEADEFLHMLPGTLQRKAAAIRIFDCKLGQKCNCAASFKESKCRGYAYVKVEFRELPAVDR